MKHFLGGDKVKIPLKNLDLPNIRAEKPDENSKIHYIFRIIASLFFYK